MKNYVLTSYPPFPQSLTTSTAQRQQGTSVCMPCQCHALSCSHRHVLPARITSSSSSNSILWIELCRAPIRWKSEGAISGLYSGWNNNVQASLVMAFRVFKLVCGLALSCWSIIYVGFLWGWTRLKLSWVLSASSCILTSTRITPSPSHETVAMTFPAHRHYESFLPRRLRMVPFHGQPFSLQFNMMAPGFIWSNNGV